MNLDLTQLPAPNVIEDLDYEALLLQRKQRLLAAAPASLRDALAATLELETEPLAILLQEDAYNELILRQRVNEAAKALMLAYSTGTDLEHLAALFDVQRLAGEQDDRLQARTQQGFAALGAAGPAAAYRAHAMAVSADIVDVSAISPVDGRVDVTVLAAKRVPEDSVDKADITLGKLLFPDLERTPGEDIVLAPNDSPLLLAAIAALSDETVRPLTDHVVVRAPTIKRAGIAARLRVYRGPDPGAVLANANKNLAAHLAKIRRLGYDMTRAGLIAAMGVAGVQNVLLDSPAEDIVCEPGDIAVAVSIDVTMEGLAE